MTRTFTHEKARRKRVPVLLGLIGPSGSGKTYSALRLAMGMARALGKPVFGLDTEHDRMTHYAGVTTPAGVRIDFEHVSFGAPFGPKDYQTAIQHCVDAGAGVLVIDSMTHEHSGEGGVLDQIDKYLDDREEYARRQGWKTDGIRDRYLMTANIKPKRERKALNNAIVQLGINAIFCYRANDKIKPRKGQEPEHVGWTAETTSTLHYEFLARLLLTPGCDGVPSLVPETDAEKRLVKNPEIVRQLFKPGQQLDEALGEKLARWGLGDESAPAARSVDREPEAPHDTPASRDFVELSKRIAEAVDDGELEAMTVDLQDAIKDRLVTPDEARRLRQDFKAKRDGFRGAA